VYLVTLQAEYGSAGVVVMEVIQDAEDDADLEEWWSAVPGFNYELRRTTPADALVLDYAASNVFLSYPTVPLVDLQTMQVLDIDCREHESYESCLLTYL
jgi:hypothetical protein